MRTLVRECAFTGKLFKDEAKYLAHLNSLRLDQRERRLHRREAREFDELLKQTSLLASMADVEDWLNDNYWTLARQYGYRYRASPRSKKVVRPGPEDKVMIKLVDIRSGAQPTSHSAPRGKKHSWWPNLQHEPGWSGNIEIRFEGQGYDFFDSSQLKAAGIHTGSGGSRSFGLGYSLTMFAEDFKAMALLEKLSRP